MYAIVIPRIFFKFAFTAFWKKDNQITTNAIKKLEAFNKLQEHSRDIYSIWLTVLSKTQKRLKLLIFESIHQHMALLVVTKQTREPELSKAATRCVLWRNVFLKISLNSQENTCARVSFLNKVVALRPNMTCMCYLNKPEIVIKKVQVYIIHRYVYIYDIAARGNKPKSN